MRRTLVLSIAIAAAAIPATANAQVPKGIQDPVWMPTETLLNACPTWTKTEINYHEYDSQCSVAPASAADVAYTCFRSAHYDEQALVYRGNCEARAGAVAVNCEKTKASWSYVSSEQDDACTAAVGDTEVEVLRCERDDSSLASHGVTRRECASGPVSVLEEHESATYPEFHSSTLTVQAGDAEVRCHDDDADQLYEASDCGVGGG